MKNFILISIITLCSWQSEAQTNIIGGKNAQRGDYPWMAQLRGNSQAICGAALIAPNWVLTAGHCAITPPQIPDATHVYINLYRRLVTVPYAEYIKIDTILVHPDFRTTNIRSGPDIALVRLEQASSFSPLPLVTPGDSNFYKTGAECRVLGWGASNTSGYRPDTLQQADISIINFDTCNAAYAASPIGQIGSFSLCAGYTSGMSQAGAGAGDSGGPLIVNDNGNWKHMGIVSGGGGIVTTAEFPGIFTRTIDQLGWIDSVIQANSPAVGNNTQNMKEQISLSTRHKLLNIRYHGEEIYDAQISVYDITGTVHNRFETMLNGHQSIPIDRLPSGIYILTIESESLRFRKKFHKF